jgi:hypothetical protein
MHLPSSSLLGPNVKWPHVFSIHITTTYGFRVRYVKQFISVTRNMWKSTYICWNQEFIGVGLHVKLSNSFLLVTVVKLTITVSNSITVICVLNFVWYVLCVDINDTYTCTNRNSYHVYIDTGYIVEWYIMRT